MKRKQGKWLLSLLLSVILTVGLLPTTAHAEEAGGGKFILVAEAGGKLVIAPEYITYAEGQTVQEALAASNHEFTGLMDLDPMITAIDGISGSYYRSDQSGDFNIKKQASLVTHYRFSETSGGSQPSEGMQLLMTAMAEYSTKEADVKLVAKEAYDAAYSRFVVSSSDAAATLAVELNKVMTDYENTLNGTKYTVRFTDGSKVYSNSNYSGISITAVNEYGRTWTDDGDGSLQLPKGSYTFRVAHEGLSVSGMIQNLASDTTVSAELPKEYWLNMKTFRLSGSYGSEESTEVKFSDAEFTLGKWNGRTVTVPVFDSFLGAVYAYAEYNGDVLADEPTLTAVYTEKDSTPVDVEVEIPFESLTVGAYSVLGKGAEGNTVIYRVSRKIEEYTYAQDYTVTFERTPTLKAITVLGTESPREDETEDTQVNQAATKRFVPTVMEYDYKVLDTIKRVKITAEPLLENYSVTVTVDGQPAADGVVDISGDTVIQVIVSANGYSNTYSLNILPNEGKKQIFTANKAVTVEVRNSDGVVMPFTTHIEGNKDRHRYFYTLVPGETYHYIATYDTYYHISDDFTLRETNGSTTIDFSSMGHWLTDLAFGVKKGSNYKNSIEINGGFSSDTHTYQADLIDTENLVFAWVGADKGITVQAIYSQIFPSDNHHGIENIVKLTAGNKTGVRLDRFLMDENPIENEVTFRLTKQIDGVTYYQDYVVDFRRILTLKDMSAKCDGLTMILNQETENPGANKKTGFVAEHKEYSIKASLLARQLELDLSVYTDNLCYGEETVGYRILVNGEDVTQTGKAVLDLENTLEPQTVVIRVENDKAPEGSAEYILHVMKSPPVAATFEIAPENALLTIHEEMSGERIWPENGIFQLCEDYRYRYALTECGYVSRYGVLTVTRNEGKALVIEDDLLGDGKDDGISYTVQEADVGGAVTISWKLEQAAVNGSINPSISAYWPDFRGNSNNNGITAARIPYEAEAGTLYWANQIGSGIDADAVGSPILVDGVIITYASDKLYRIDTVTGEILATGTMDHKSSFSITPPTYANGMVFVALSNGCVQAFNAQTLESLWIYKDMLGGQPNCPLTVRDGYLYTGFWNSETGNANYVCMSITDENPEKADEAKCASWYYTSVGGYYWAGAYVGTDFVMVGTDDGDNSYTSQTSRMLLLDAKTGELLDSWNNLNGDVRSTVVYANGAYYFTSKGGTFYCVRVSDAGKFCDSWTVSLRNGVGGVPMSTCSPVVYNGRAYVGVSGAGQFTPYSGHNITVIDLNSRQLAYSVSTQGYPQTSGLLTTAYEEESGFVYVYFFDNQTPGKLRVLRDKAGQPNADYVTLENGVSTAYALFTPAGDQKEYAICSPITDEYGTIYFKNDSAHLMAFGSAIEKIEVTQMPAKTAYIVGETFDPSGMVVTATYANGLTRDVTPYVSYNQELTAEDETFTITFEYVMYHNKENGQEMEDAVKTNTPYVDIQLTIGAGKLGDVNRDEVIDSKDAQMILDYEAQLLESPLILSISDVSGDGEIDSDDAVLISQFVAGKIQKFPVEENNTTE